MPRQRFANQTEASHVQLGMVSACTGGDRLGCKTGPTTGIDDRFARAVQVIMLVGCEGR